jgi:ribose transport system ATP-binding protein
MRTTGAGRAPVAEYVSTQVSQRGTGRTRAGSGRPRGLASAFGSLLFAARFVPIWIGTGLLLVVAAIIAPETLTSTSLNSGVLPLTTFVAIAAIGQMLVVMTGGIDLSMAGLITLIGNVLVGVSQGSNGHIASAIVICLAWSALIGLANGTLVAIVGLNPLIVTLATGEILYGISTQYILGTSSVAGVPPLMAKWSLERFLGVGWIFWVGIVITIAVALLLRYTRGGRRFQAVGANSQAAWISGLRVRGHVVLAYVCCSLLGGVTAILLASLIQTPNISLGDPYLLGPISAVVIGGASLLGGLASTTSTWIAAFALTVLSQMLQVLGLTSALQYVVYGAAIIIGMLVSGDRVANLCSRFLIQRGPAANLLSDIPATSAPGDGDVDPQVAQASSELAVSAAGDTAVAAPARRGDVAPVAPVLALTGISKRFGAVQAVDDVSIECYPGEVHAVVGENGSGKSTLLGVACGALAADTGSVEIGGERLTTASTAAAMHLGVGMTFQAFSQVLPLSIAENLFLSAAPDDRPPYGRMTEWAAAVLGELGLDLDPTTSVARLTLAERQFLEIAKALVRRPKVLLLDEPTTALGPGEVEKLHALIRARVALGVAVVYVSHRLPEVLGLAHRVTVLRDGVRQGTFSASALSESRLVALMIGRPLELAFPEHEPVERGAEPMLDIQGLRAERFGPLDLQLAAGEIVGIAGAEGNGQGQFMRSLAGVEHAGGVVRRKARRMGVSLRSPRSALAAGIALLSADRANESLFPVLGLRANATIQVLKRFSRAGLVSRRRERAAVLALAGPLQIRAASTEQPVAFLSGGNQQKVVLMRPFLRPDLKVLLVDEPTQGVDVRSRFDIYRALREKVAEGCAVVIKSSDPLELSGICDRVIVMSRGRIVEEIPAAELNPPAEVGERRIIEAIVGSRPAAAIASTPAETAASAAPASGARTARRSLRYRNWMPIAVIVLLMFAIGGYTASRAPAFSTNFNLSGLFVSVVPLALVAMGQLNAMLVGGFDVSVGSIMSFCVVIASFTMGAGEAWWELLLGALAVIGVAFFAGAFNAILIRFGKLSPIIATLATLSIWQGLALVLRPVPKGLIDLGVVSALTKSIGPIPYSFIGVVILAVGWDLWLYRSGHGLATRAVGFNETAASRTGLRAGRIFVRGFLLSAVLAGVGAIFLGAQIDVGDPNSGMSFALESIAAAVLGGAALTGGRGSFIGATVGALFLFLIINVLPYLNISSAYGQVATGALTLIALSAYSGPEIWSRVRGAIDPFLRDMRLRREARLAPSAE